MVRVVVWIFVFYSLEQRAVSRLCWIQTSNVNTVGNPGLVWELVLLGRSFALGPSLPSWDVCFRFWVTLVHSLFLPLFWHRLRQCPPFPVAHCIVRVGGTLRALTGSPRSESSLWGRKGNYGAFLCFPSWVLGTEISLQCPVDGRQVSELENRVKYGASSSPLLPAFAQPQSHLSRPYVLLISGPSDGWTRARGSFASQARPIFDMRVKVPGSLETQGGWLTQ